MRLCCMLTVTLLAATAAADTHTVPYEVVHVLPDTQQVLVFDREHNTHILLTVGSSVGDSKVVEIDGISMTLETPDNQRFAVYPRAAQGLALNLDKGNGKDLPAVFSTVEPTPSPAEIAQSTAVDEFADALGAMDSTKHLAVGLAALFFEPVDEETASAGPTSSLIVSLK